jgi:hypothetical protein
MLKKIDFHIITLFYLDTAKLALKKLPTGFITCHCAFYFDNRNRRRYCNLPLSFSQARGSQLSLLSGVIYFNKHILINPARCHCAINLSGA